MIIIYNSVRVPELNGIIVHAMRWYTPCSGTYPNNPKLFKKERWISIPVLSNPGCCCFCLLMSADVLLQIQNLPVLTHLVDVFYDQFGIKHNR